MNADLKTKLEGFGLNETHINKLEEEGVNGEEDLVVLLEAVGNKQGLKSLLNCGLVQASKIYDAFAPAPTPSPVPQVEPTNTTAPVSTGTTPSPTQINGLTSQFGIDPTMLMMFMNMGPNSGMPFDISSAFPIGQLAQSYTPKEQNMVYWMMDQIEARFGTPIIIINEDGGVNADLTAKYVKSLQDGLDPLEDGIYFDDNNVAHEIIGVGVDTQSVYDADPLNSRKPLRDGRGSHNINYNKTTKDVKQLIHFAVELGELNPNDNTQVARLRDKVEAGTSRTQLATEFTKAAKEYNERSRIGTLPELKISIVGRARRKETMSRRVRRDARGDLNGYEKERRGSEGSGGF